MKLNLLLIIISIAIGFGVTQFFEFSGSNETLITQVPSDTTYEPASNGQAIPDFQITSLDNKVIHIQDLRDNTILMNFWASWCAPCIVELPELLTLAKKNPDIFVILLSNDLTKEALLRHLDKLPSKDLKLPNIIIAWDEKGKITRNIFQTFQLPETVLIDKQGRLQHKFVGLIDWKDAQVLEIIKQSISTP